MKYAADPLPDAGVRLLQSGVSDQVVSLIAATSEHLNKIA